MNVFGKLFEFDGVSSDKYGVMLCSFETSNNTKETAISYNLNIGDITPNRPVANYYNKQYKQPLEFKITLSKICNENKRFSIEEQRKIIRWITSPVNFRKFKICDYNGNMYHYAIEYYCICIDYQEVIINDNLVGMIFSFQCNAPYGFYKEDITKFISTTSTSIIINNYSDEREMVYYPKIEVTGISTGDITICNNAIPDKIMELSLHNGQTLCIDNELCDITDNTNQFKYSTDTNLVWIGLLPGKNEITITGSAQGQFVCRYPRKVGI